MHCGCKNSDACRKSFAVACAGLIRIFLPLRTRSGILFFFSYFSPLTSPFRILVRVIFIECQCSQWGEEQWEASLPFLKKIKKKKKNKITSHFFITLMNGQLFRFIFIQLNVTESCFVFWNSAIDECKLQSNCIRWNSKYALVSSYLY